MKVFACCSPAFLMRISASPGIRSLGDLIGNLHSIWAVTFFIMAFRLIYKTGGRYEYEEKTKSRLGRITKKDEFYKHSKKNKGQRHIDDELKADYM